jgi:hypothetical protein
VANEPHRGKVLLTAESLLFDDSESLKMCLDFIKIMTDEDFKPQTDEHLGTNSEFDPDHGLDGHFALKAFAEVNYNISCGFKTPEALT